VRHAAPSDNVPRGAERDTPRGAQQCGESAGSLAGVARKAAAAARAAT
jgi:hypothetical protein